MGAVKNWGMEQVERRAQQLYERGMSWDTACEQAEEEIFGPTFHGNDEPPEPST